jgi:hypothetical protein
MSSFGLKDMGWKAASAQPLRCITEAIGSDAFSTFSQAGILLVLLVRIANESPTRPFSGMVRSPTKLMNRGIGSGFHGLLILLNPRVDD